MTDTIHFVKPRLLLVMISLCAPCRNLTAAESAPAPSLEHLWPAYRHDNSLAGISPLRGGLGKRPTLSWSIDLGAAEEPSETWRFADLDGDGTNDFLRILGNRLICESIGGDRLWESATLSQPAVLQMRDFAGNGRIGLLVKSETGTQTLFHMIDGATGESALLYTMPRRYLPLVSARTRTERRYASRPYPVGVQAAGPAF